MFRRREGKVRLQRVTLTPFCSDADDPPAAVAVVVVVAVVAVDVFAPFCSMMMHHLRRH